MTDYKCFTGTIGRRQFSVVAHDLTQKEPFFSMCFGNGHDGQFSLIVHQACEVRAFAKALIAAADESANAADLARNEAA